MKQYQEPVAELVLFDVKNENVLAVSTPDYQPDPFGLDEEDLGL